jgi:hypothetical protein
MLQHILYYEQGFHNATRKANHHRLIKIRSQK